MQMGNALLNKMAAPMVRQILANAARNQATATTSRGFVGSSCYNQTKEEKTQLDENPFFNKYADKIKKMQKSDPEKFKSNVDSLKSKSKWEDAQQKDKQQKEIKPKAAPLPRLLKGDGDSSQQTLDSVMKLDLIKDLPAEEISRVWKEFHAKKDCISAVIPSPTFEQIQKKSQLYPLFLYPLPRPQGYEFIFAQFQGNNCYFTSLINYQTHQENAPILLTMMHYTELMKDKGIVLMKGALDTSGMATQDAAILANQLQLYYATGNQDRTHLLNTFNNDPNNFKHMDVISQFENIHMELPTATPGKS